MSPLTYYNGCSYQRDGRWLWVRRSLGGIWQRRPVTQGWRDDHAARSKRGTP